jgi:hypothetical protein
MIEDFLSSGVMDAPDHRFIAFDRPGFGHSDRPHDRVWVLGSRRGCSCAHRLVWGRAADRRRPLLGSLVALAMALGPDDVAGLVRCRDTTIRYNGRRARLAPARSPYARRPSPYRHPFHASPPGAGTVRRVCAVRSPTGSSRPIAAARPADIADASRRRGNGDAAGSAKALCPL